MNNIGNHFKRNEKSRGLKIFPVPFSFLDINRNTYIQTNDYNKFSNNDLKKEKSALNLKENIIEAKNLCEYYIKNGITDPVLFFNYGSILKKLGQSKDAEIYLRKSIQLNPNLAEAYANLGNLLSELDQSIEAELLIRKSIKLKPDSSDLNCNLGALLKDVAKLEEAEEYTLKAIKLNPNNFNAYLNLGIILKDLGKLEEAKINTQKAIELKPRNAEAYFNLATIELFQGKYESGFKHYEFRYAKNKPNFPHANPKIERITSQKLTNKEKLLVISEQGLGDTLQYMRYIPLLRRNHLNVSFCAQKKLHSLIKASGIDPKPLTPEQANKISEGKWISLLSLPYYLKINPIIQENPQPYIRFEDKLITKWKIILSSEKRPIIGINWQGNLNMEKKTYKGRSIPLETFSRIIKKNDITFLSLQKGYGSEQLENCSFKNKFVSCQSRINSTWDFLENAAIIENCDLIITCDTSIAHLAGGMGKKVWLLLKNVPFWTWGLEKEKTIWYPSMKLFRQKEKHNWQELMQRVSDTLVKEFVHKY